MESKTINFLSLFIPLPSTISQPTLVSILTSRLTLSVKFINMSKKLISQIMFFQFVFFQNSPGVKFDILSFLRFLRSHFSLVFVNLLTLNICQILQQIFYSKQLIGDIFCFGVAWLWYIFPPEQATLKNHPLIWIPHLVLLLVISFAVFKTIIANFFSCTFWS